MKRSTLALITCLFFAAAASAAPVSPGLSYSYYEGNWANMPDFSSLSALKTGASSNIDLAVRSRDIYYAILWQGSITIPADGTYTFETVSDDGSMLYVGSSAVVNNDGQHGTQTRTGSITLAAGVYPVRIAFMNACCDGIMQLYWSSNAGLARQLVPDNAFVPAAASTTTQGLDYSYFEGGWSSMPDLASMKAIKTGSSSNLDLSIRDRGIYYAILWQGFITVPASATYTFETVSDDGSMVYIGQNAALLVNNDGQHSTQTRTGSIYLAAGVYPVSIAFMNACCDAVMQLYWSSNAGLTRQLVPDNALSHTAATTAPVVVTPAVVVSTGSTETSSLTSAVNYYFSSSTGDDSRSAAQAQNPATPWRTLSRLNSALASAQPGTAMLLKRGDSFEGSINVTASGSAQASIIISAYGTGNKPVISGFASAASWTSLGNGIWEAPLTTSIAKLNMVVRDNQIQAMGRWPNITEANRGYMTFQAHNGTQTIMDSHLPAYPNWTGAELVIRKNRWTIDRGTVIYHSGNTIAQTDPSGMEPINGFGYFIQNDPRTLDQPGEWYFNPSSKKLQIFTGGASPAAYGFKASVTDTLLTIRSKSYITLDNLSLQGANSYAIAVYDNANFVTIQNCSLDFSGINAITGNFTRNLSLSGSVINHTNNNGLYLAPYCWNTIISNNTIKNTGLLPGLGASNNQAHEGMTIDGAGSIIRNNVLDSTGYIAIAFTRDSVTVINNFVNNFALTTDDGAGIYTHDAGYKGRRILSNIVLNGKGSHEGTDNPQDLSAQGIGTDDMTTDVEISGNTVANCSGKGIGLHNSQFITLSGNTAFNNKDGQIEFDHDFIAANSPIRNITMNNNILFAKTALQPVFTIVTKNDDVSLFGTADNNYFCRPADDRLTFHMHSLWSSGQDKVQNYDLAHWKGLVNQDMNSRKSPLSIAPYLVAGTGASMISNGSFDNNTDGVMNPASGYSSLSLDKGTLDGGALRVTYTGAGTGLGQPLNLWFYDPANAQTLLAGHSYRVRFSIKGNQDNNTDFYAVIRSASTNTSSESQTFKVYSTRQEIELIFVPAANIASSYLSVYMMNAAGCPGFVIDNVKMEEVTLNYTNVDDFIRFEYNATGTARTVSLDAEYVDVKNTLYAYSVTLAPYSSAVLIRKSASALVSAQDQTLAMTASATASEAVREPVVPVSVKVSPNPATSQVQLSHGLQLSTPQAATIIVYNAAGTAVKTIRMNLTSQPVSLSVADLAAGVYTIKLETGKSSVITRFVKM